MCQDRVLFRIEPTLSWVFVLLIHRFSLTADRFLTLSLTERMMCLMRDVESNVSYNTI